jgi:hypothetical protein
VAFAGEGSSGGGGQSRFYEDAAFHGWLRKMRFQSTTGCCGDNSQALPRCGVRGELRRVWRGLVEHRAFPPMPR